MQLSEEEKQKLRDAGFDEEAIAAYEQDQSQQAAPAPVSPETADSGLPKLSETEIPATTPPPENTYTESVLGVVPAISEALPYLGGAGGGAILYGAAKKYGEGKKAELASEQLRQSEMMKREQYRQEQLNQRQQMRMGPGQPGPQQVAPKAPVQPGSPGQPAVQTGMPSAMNKPPAQPDKMVIFKQPNAGNYIERMSELSKTYGQAQQVVQPQAQPQPKPSGFPRGPMRGGGGGGGGGAMVFDPTQRRKPLQF